MQLIRLFFLAASVPLLWGQEGPSLAQDLSESYRRLAGPPVGSAEVVRTCGLPSDYRFQYQLKATVNTPGSMVDGAAIRGDQFPRFLRPNHDSNFGFDRFAILGDHEAVDFERYDLTGSNINNRETWQRIGTDAVAGRLVSIFRPVWGAETLRAVLAQQRWGVDRPNVLLGHVISPNMARQPLYLQLVPPNLPPSEVVRISETVQFTSHVVNLWVPGFGDARIQAGNGVWGLPALATMFYEHFSDEYETLVVVTQSQELREADNFHRNVRNDVAGIGLRLFDDTAQYGSASVLQGVEVLPSPRWAENATALHQQAHQWSEYSAAWEVAGLVRSGYDPLNHTPLLTPGAVMAGAVLKPTRRVVQNSGEGNFEISETLPIIQYHPLTLYRMGLVSNDEIPTVLVFENQLQFGVDESTEPNRGVVVQGSTMTVGRDAFIMADGIRNGPSVPRVRRAVIYVSRNGLASQEEMNAVNFFAARLSAEEGVTSWERYPGFFGATGGRSRLESQIKPLKVPPMELGPDVEYLPIATDALVGVLFDRPVPGKVEVDQTVYVSGVLTLRDRTDYSIFCLRFFRYGSPNVNETFVCGSLRGRRFSFPVTFMSGQEGTYTIEPFAFWSNSGPQSARSRYGTMVVGHGS